LVPGGKKFFGGVEGITLGGIAKPNKGIRIE
jgi:hypothetical protein